MLECIANNFNTVAGSVIAACFVAYLGWRTFLKTRAVQASDKFRATILDELKELYPEGIYAKNGIEVRKALKRCHDSINKAVIEYMEHVKDSRGFQGAWNEFSGLNMHREHGEEARYSHYAIKSVLGNDFHKNPQKQFVKDVEHLLSYAVKT